MLKTALGRQVQGSTNRRAPGLVNFVPAFAYHCLNLPAAFTQPGARLLVEPCTFSMYDSRVSKSTVFRLIDRT